ncbi:DUF928 domain-containing protein [Candidatus Magnetominusculus dajiuhuensis]|uniref:DUF928 domain-containing protein n=1 Tax=Candidatus Magnetominusculus dajiuhuensis TaxID=3137712 RepID=UPI003B4305BF
MKSVVSRCIFMPVLLIAAICSPLVLYGADTESDKSGAIIKYIPPKLGAPSVRTGGGTRGNSGDAIELTVLAPAHTGLSSKTQPSLCWYMSKASKLKIEISISETKAARPLLEKTAEINTGGINCVNLKEYGVSLAVGTEYKWFVSVIGSEENRSKDIVSGGAVIVAEPSKELANKLSASKGIEKVALYAKEGYWYDSIEGISNLIKQAPNDKGLREVRASLLEQAGLKEAADIDRKM